MTEGAAARTGYADTFAADNLPPRDLWPEMIVTRPEFSHPARLNCVSDLLDRWVEAGEDSSARQEKLASLEW